MRSHFAQNPDPQPLSYALVILAEVEVKPIKAALANASTEKQHRDRHSRGMAGAKRS